uniref:Uncharacterized protein n=1 Tax=Oryza sativa subsp. japonica TaxID=39947 RepID=Q5Z4P1_ORYSJ|nr:hypothetical protein [Oryza sativa Japonica Group]
MAAGLSWDGSGGTSPGFTVDGNDARRHRHCPGRGAAISAEVSGEMAAAHLVDLVTSLSPACVVAVELYPINLGVCLYGGSIQRHASMEGRRSCLLAEQIDPRMFLSASGGEAADHFFRTF